MCPDFSSSTVVQRRGSAAAARMRGVSLVEVLAALAIGAVMTVGVVAMVNGSLQDTRAQEAGWYQAEVAAAAARYLADHQADLLAGAGAAGATTPVAIGLDRLKADGYLPVALPAANAYRQVPCLLVLQPKSGLLEALLVTEQGEPVSVDEIGYAAANAGAGGGYIPYTDPAGNGAVGAFKSFALTAAHTADFLKKNCSGAASGAGHLATMLSYRSALSSAADVIYRDAQPGHPELNSMATPLHIAFKAKEGPSADSTCSPADTSTWGRMAVDDTGAMLSCQSGAWKKLGGGGSWKDPVSTFSALPLADNGDGDVRVVLDQGRAFTWITGNWIELDPDKDGATLVSNRLTTSELMLTRTVAAAGTACASDPEGTLAVDGGSMLMSCQSGTWQTLSGQLRRAQGDVGCSVLLPSSYADAVRNCANDYDGPLTWTAPYDMWNTTIKRTVKPAKNGILSTNVWVEANRRSLSASGWKLKLFILLDVIDNDTGAAVAHAESQAPTIMDDATTLNVTLNKALKTNDTGYTVNIQTLFSTLQNDWTGLSYGAPVESNRKNWDTTAPEQETPLTAFWNIELFQ